MKITAGMGGMDAFEKLVNAGADEVFCGYVPAFWNEKYGNVCPLNRREVLFYHVQIGTLEDMKILRTMSTQIAVTFNALYYTKEQIEDVIRIIRDLIDIGFSDFIIADINLIRTLSERKIPCHIHVSGEIGEWNCFVIRLLMTRFSNETTRITRLIFHRKNDIADMKKMIQAAREIDPALEFEAFCMNEKCHYTGGYCSSLHCDEMVHLCQLEYRMAPQSMSKPAACYEPESKQEQNKAEESEQECSGAEECCAEVGTEGCGLCAIPRLSEIGITHLKIVGRGLSAEAVARDIHAVRRVCEGRLVKKEKTVTKNCYYLS